MTIQFSEFLYKSLFFWKAISNDNCCAGLTTPMWVKYSKSSSKSKSESKYESESKGVFQMKC